MSCRLSLSLRGGFPQYVVRIRDHRLPREGVENRMEMLLMVMVVVVVFLCVWSWARLCIFLIFSFSKCQMKNSRQNIDIRKVDEIYTQLTVVEC